MSSSISNNFETLGREEEMLEKLIFWFLTLSPPLSIACFAAGEKLLNELEKMIPIFPLIWKQELHLAKLMLTLSTENTNIESNNVIFFFSFSSISSMVLWLFY